MKDIIGKKLAGGALSLKLFSKVLGLDGKDATFRLKAVAWITDHMEIAVEAENGKEIVFSIGKLQAVQLSLFNTKHLTIRCRGEELSSSLNKIIVGEFSGRWFNLKIEKLVKLLVSDPEFGKPGLPMPKPGDVFKKPKSLLDTWGDGDVYASFWAKGELERAQLDSIDFFEDCIFIQHSDLECVNVKPCDRGLIMQSVNHPWDNRIRNMERPAGASHNGAKKEDAGCDIGSVSTDLTDEDVIMGSLPKVKQRLDYVLSKNTDKMVFFSNTCVPTMTAEDVESTVKQYQKKFSVPLTYLTVTPQSMTNVFIDLLVHRRLRAEQVITEPDPHAINLVGFQHDASMDELMKLLIKMEIRVNTLLLPHLKFKDIDIFPQASLNVFMPNVLWQHLYDQLLAGSRTKYIFPGTPYGISRTKKWFMDILSALEKQSDFRELWQESWNNAKAQWDDLVNEAKNYRLGLCLRSDEIHYLLDPANTWGIPLLGMIEEMGFGMDIMMKSGTGDSDAQHFSYIKEILEFPDKHHFYTFSDFKSMRKTLLESRCDAVLSNHFFDWRLTESGKNQFSLQYFEKGIDGALRTAKRLLEVCRMPFYKNYFKYLRRTPAGLYPDVP